MNIFETIKEQLNMIDIAEHYGITVKQNGFTNCIFHSDKHPSMKLYKDHYHCFACGAHGDAISFSAQLFGLSPYNTAKKIASDFGIADIKAISSNKPYLSERETQSLLKRYISSLESNRDKYRPCSPDEELHPLYVEAVQKLPLYEYYLNILTSSSKEERKLFIKEERRFFNELRGRLRNAGMAV